MLLVDACKSGGLEGLRNFGGIGKLLAVKPGGRGDVTESHLLWKHPTKYTDHIVSPLIADGRMLLVKGGGIATCFETEGGTQLYGPERIQNAGDYFASPVMGDGKIYVADTNHHRVQVIDLANNNQVTPVVIQGLKPPGKAKE